MIKFILNVYYLLISIYYTNIIETRYLDEKIKRTYDKILLKKHRHCNSVKLIHCQYLYLSRYLLFRDSHKFIHLFLILLIPLYLANYFSHTTFRFHLFFHNNRNYDRYLIGVVFSEIISGNISVIFSASFVFAPFIFDCTSAAISLDTISIIDSVIDDCLLPAVSSISVSVLIVPLVDIIGNSIDMLMQS